MAAPILAAVEDFVLSMSPKFVSDYAFVVPQPWLAQARLSSNVWVPDPGAQGFAQDVLAGVVERFATILIPCTFETQEERDAVSTLIEQLDEYRDAVVLLVQLTGGRPLSRELLRVLTARYKEMLDLIGCSGGVLHDPKGCPEMLMCEVSSASASIKVIRERSGVLVQCLEQQAPTFEAVIDMHRKLLWEEIPRALMKEFPPVDTELVEVSNKVGGFKLLQQFRARRHKVLLAEPQGGDPKRVVFKVFEKADCLVPADVENIYREFRFTKDIQQHPHIAKCLAILNSKTRVYLIFEFVGQANLANLLNTLPGQRMHEDDALDCSSQIASALAHCHSMNLAHRQVSLEHIVVHEREETYYCRLVDFSYAICNNGSGHSLTCCGSLPCMAPEIALGQPYIPWPVDCWSLGIVLLEAAAGLGTVEAVVDWNEDTELEDAGSMICEFFRQGGGHRQALAARGGEPDVFVLDRLLALLKVEPSERAPLSTLN